MALTTMRSFDVYFYVKGPPEKPEEIKIKEVNNGFIVTAGCQKFVFGTFKQLTAALELFYTDYEKAYKKYMRKEVK